MLIMPLIDFYATACDWLGNPHADGHAPKGLFWFVIVSFFNGIVIEIGRKIRSKEKEEVGVQTYSALWGPARAALIWWVIILLTACSAIAAANLINFLLPTAILLSVCVAGIGIVVCRFMRHSRQSLARWFEPMSGGWTILMYLLLGTIPLFAKILFEKS
jgi:hypothetical protein